MKNINSKSFRALVFAGALVTAGGAFAQSTVMTTSAGTISEFGPSVIMVKTDTSPTAVSYGYSKTTTYVDEMGSPVSIETVKSGLPVTVYYDQVGGQMMASKVVVRKAVAAPMTPVTISPVIEQKTTTTTTETK